MEKFITFLDQLETVPLALLTKLGPWITPLIPALFVQRAIVKHLETPEDWGWIAAISLEIVGIASINSLLTAYTWNQEKRVKDPAAPIAWNIGAAISYFATAFLLVLILEFWPIAAKLTPAAFVVLSGTSALILALADDQKRREKLVSEKANKRLARRSKPSITGQPDQDTDQNTPPPTGQPDQNNGQHPDNDRQNGNQDTNNGHLLTGKKVKQKQAEAKLLTFYADNPEASHAIAANAIGRSRPWVSGKLSEFEKSGLITRNGQGVKIVKNED